MGGGITGDFQIYDTDLHSPLKKGYRNQEMDLMIRQLEANPGKIPQPNRNEMMHMLVRSQDNLNIDFPARFKALWMTNALDGSEDYLVSQRIMDLVGPEMKKFREKLMKTTSPKGWDRKGLRKIIIPPKGVKMKARFGIDDAPLDEGEELLDCEEYLMRRLL